MAGVKTRAQRKKQADAESTAASPLHELHNAPRTKITKTKTSTRSKKSANEESTALVASFSRASARESKAQSSLSHHDATGPFPSAASGTSLTRGALALLPSSSFSEGHLVNSKEFFTASLASESAHDAAPTRVVSVKPAKVPREPHALIHIWVNPSSRDLQAAQPRAKSSIAAAFPLSHLEAVLAALAPKGLQQTTSTVLTSSIATQTEESSLSKRKLPDDADMPQPSSKPRLEPALKTKSGICEEVAQAEGRSPIKGQRTRILSSPAEFNITPKGKTPSRLRPRHKYNEKGELIMEATTELSDSEILENTSRQTPFPRHSQQITRIEEASNKGDDSTTLVLAETQGTPPEPLAIVRIEGNSQEAGPSPSEPSTPARSGWGLGSILTSARTVTRFFPGLGRSQPNLPPVVPATLATSRVGPSKSGRHATLSYSGSPIRAPHIESAASNVDDNVSNEVNDSQETSPRSAVTNGPLPSTLETTPTRSHATQTSDTNEAQSVGTGPSKSTSAGFQASTKEKGQDIPEEVVQHTVGSKRKRAPSPKIIPNPPGAYGMVDKYFEMSSSEEDNDDNDEQAASPVTPTPTVATSSTEYRWRKKPRLETWGDQQASSSPSSIRKSISSLPRANFPSFTIAAVKDANDRGQLDPEDPTVRILDGNVRIDARFTGMVNPTQPNSFQVPGWDTDDSSLDEDDDDITVTPQATSAVSISDKGHGSPSTPNVFLASSSIRSKVNDSSSVRNGAPVITTSESRSMGQDGSSISNGAPIHTLANGSGSNSDHSISNGAPAGSSNTIKQGNSWSQPPPAPPNPSHATLPASGALADSERLNAARAKALQHAPQKPSRLRESSRISSSPAAAVHEDSNEADNQPSEPTPQGRRPLGEVSKSSQSDFRHANRPRHLPR